jgi:hypothetical protein
MRPLNHFTSAEEGSLRFTALDFSGDNVIVAGRVLYLRDIRYFVETLIGEIKEHMKIQLFFGLDIVDVEWSPGVVHEQPRNISVGYSCFRDPHNAFAQRKDDLLRAVLTHPLLHGHFHYIDQRGQIVWKAATCFAYMDACHELEMMFFAGTQTSVGEPGRGTEVASHLIENVSGGTIRNILVLFQYFCMMGTFNKTSHVKGCDVTMMRVPHPELGRLWLVYFTFVRPLLIIWQQYFQGRSAAARARSRLFFGPHQPVTSSELSRALSFHTQRLLNVKIPISLWRHIVTWFLNHHSARFSDHLALSNRSALAIQSGHNETSHSLYAADARLPARIDFHVFFQTMRTSGVWHDLVGFESKLLRDMSHQNQMVATTRPRTDHAMVHESGVHVDSSPSVRAIAEAITKTLIPDLLRLNSQTRANDLASLLEAVGLDIHSPVSRPLGEPVTHFLHPSRLRGLRKFLGDDHAAFKHTQQALATELVASKNLSLLLIGPTGMLTPSYASWEFLKRLRRFRKNLAALS